jgi:protein ImuB
LPRPSPALVLPQPLAAVILDGTGAFVGVSARLEMSGAPASLRVPAAAAAGGGAAGVVGWAGPWPGDERWWAGDDARRCVRLQIGLADGRALLLTLIAGQWSVEAVYD